MNTKKGMILLILISIALTAYAFSVLPETIAVHWGLSGNADGFAGKEWGLGLFPLLVFVMYGIFVIIPKMDPLKKNIESFQEYFGQFMMAMQLFIIYVFGLVIAYNLKPDFNFGVWLIPGFVFLLSVLGKMLEHAKQNYFIGIRTPWTLADEDVWNETHHRTGKLYHWAALVPLIGLLDTNFIVWVVAAGVLPALYGVIISYLLFLEKKDHKKNTKKNTPFWFRKKWFGWGWYPSSIEGWMVTGVFVLFLVWWMDVLKTVPTNGKVLHFAGFGVAILLLVIICYQKGEKPEWQWMNKPVFKKKK